MASNPIYCPPMQPSYSTGSEGSLQFSFSYPDVYASSLGESDMPSPQSSPHQSSMLAPSSPFDQAESYYFDLTTASLGLPPQSPASLESQMSLPYDTQARWPQGWEADLLLLPSSSSPSSVSYLAEAADLPPGPSSSKPPKPYTCTTCGRSFTRSADQKRHQSSVHYPVYQDCPIEDCPRKGINGFPRRDHLMEHIRSFHNIDVPKRVASKRVTK
ncbi:hypothetical protein ASPZODRAFT_130807 [Penicilliopsis zonata CBS 506.65]|uniref:C2H2-type domain-containing protein n=1 Tax=Penicilliopsis zonata CBS 506.65 TaxID=1073090 RepID=A0A1L9SN95_9EURO|nr:hypothetical protein ASPZODRAFT_130807 [Penicilliopsis zonata CBS 506.65]OJJ48695.1 hypothetical protein ASPZODRAFT_130807 [Penicilliopsis zonata CBS 506.65]